MARTTSVTLGEPLNEFVAKMIESGRYGSSSEVMRSALRLLEEQEAQMEALRLAIKAGDESGESDLTISEFLAIKRASHNV
ncbi:type II toxin-antitoxin system ParD family antitoxin [Testudinibacter sp. P27/CKL/0425]